MADVAIAVIISVADVGVGCACLGVCLVVIFSFSGSVTVVNVGAGLVTHHNFVWMSVYGYQEPFLSCQLVSGIPVQNAGQVIEFGRDESSSVYALKSQFPFASPISSSNVSYSSPFSITCGSLGSWPILFLLEYWLDTRRVLDLSALVSFGHVLCDTPWLQTRSICFDSLGNTK